MQGMKVSGEHEYILDRLLGQQDPCQHLKLGFGFKCDTSVGQMYEHMDASVLCMREWVRACVCVHVRACACVHVFTCSWLSPG